MHTEDLFDLRRLAQPALQVTRPPAVDIRRRGTVRRRHRLMATVAAGAAVAMLATGVAYGATQSLDGLGWLDRSADPTPTRVVPPPMGTPRATGPSDPRTTSTDAPSQPGPTPSAPSPSAPTESSSTTSQGAAQPTWGNVPTAEDLWWNEPGDLSQKTEETGWPSEQPPSACVVDPSELRATTVLTRTFGGGSDGRLEEVALVMGFASEADAVAARDRISAWYRGCIERLRADGAVKTFPTEPDQTVLGSGVEPDGTATVFAQIGWQTPEQAKQEVGTWEDSVVVQRGNRLVWLVTPKRDVQSNNCTPTAEDAELRCVTANQVPTVARLLGEALIMDEATFDAFYERSYGRVVAQVYMTCGNLAEAQDCAQEAFVRAWDRRRRVRWDDNPEAWVRTVAHRLSISRWRKHRRSVLVGENAPEPESNDPDAADRIALHRALQELPIETRRVIVLHHFHDLAVADVAQEIGVPVGTVKARLSRGRAKLAEILGRPDPGDPETSAGTSVPAGTATSAGRTSTGRGSDRV